MLQFIIWRCHNGCNIDIIYDVIRELRHMSTQYGLPRILIYVQQGWSCPDGLVIQHWCLGYVCYRPSLAARPSTSSVAHAVNNFRNYDSIQAWWVGHQITIGFKANHKNKYTFKHRVNLYCKPIAVIPHVSVYHVTRCNLIFTVFYMHAFINLLFSLSCYSSLIFTK